LYPYFCITLPHTPESNPVLLGFDVVEYHFIPSYKEGGVPVQGLSQYAFNFEGYQFWFKNESNRNLFINDPWKYAPAWGGFCSWGVGLEVQGWPWATDFLGPPAGPWDGWSIVDGKLIFNIWESYTDRFLADKDANMKLAQDRWTKWWGRLEAGPFNTRCIGDGPLKNWCLEDDRRPSPAWLRPLPECNATAVTNVSGNGGNVDAQPFENADKSLTLRMHSSKKWVGVLCSLLGLFFLIFLVLGLIKKKRTNTVLYSSCKAPPKESRKNCELCSFSDKIHGESRTTDLE